MIWLDISEENGRTIYLDIRGIESRRLHDDTVFVISGILGDGIDETEVLMDIGRQVEVTFVDEWLHNERHLELFTRIDRAELVKTLAASAAEMSFCVENFPHRAGKSHQRVRGYRTEGHWLPIRPQSYCAQMELPLTVSEAAA